MNSTIDLHMKKFENLSPEKVEQFFRDLYVDDSSTSFPNIKDAYDFYLFVLKTLRDGSFRQMVYKFERISRTYISRPRKTF